MTSKPNNYNFKQFSLIGLVVGILGMIIIPVPQGLLDVLIAVNIALTVVVMMVVLYMQSPLEISSFPSILLVLALFRIGITISSSRLILLDGDAGEIISAFGNFVVGGNLVVGVIVFAIITIINFIVITKGSERVAEVTARFSLDAMPGKQMSIDSDLRAGNIDMTEAKRRRNVLALESRLFGSMDGAMKFVKGDAIASIMDIMINIVGGLIIGMLQHSLTFIDALQTYSILTVGDGLVQQIPSLLISITAGVMITRVNDDDNKDDLGGSIIKQLFSQAKVLYSAAILFIFLSLVPGMPTIVFVVLSCLLLGLAYYLQKHPHNNQDNSDSLLIEKEEIDGYLDPEFVSWKVQPITIHLSKEMKKTNYPTLIKKYILSTQQHILSCLGLEIPKVVLLYKNNYEQNSYQINFFETPVYSVKFYPNHLLILGKDQKIKTDLTQSHEVIENTVNIGYYDKGYWIDRIVEDQCKQFNISYISVEKFIEHQIQHTFTKSLSEFITMVEVKNMFDKMSDYQDLIKELYRMVPLNKLTEILKRLIEEEIPIRNFKAILDCLLEWGQKEREPIVLVEYVRIALGRYIANRFINGNNQIKCFILDEDIEEVIREGIRFNDKGSYLSIDPSVQEQIINKIIIEYDTYLEAEITPPLITQVDIRCYVYSILKPNTPIQVLSFQELEKYVVFDSLGVISMDF